MKATKKKIFILIAIAMCVLVIGYFWVRHMVDGDCDRARNKLGDKGITFTDVSTTDGIGVNHTFFGCEISGGFDNWYVTFWGQIFP